MWILKPSGHKLWTISPGPCLLCHESEIALLLLLLYATCSRARLTTSDLSNGEVVIGDGANFMGLDLPLPGYVMIGSTCSYCPVCMCIVELAVCFQGCAYMCVTATPDNKTIYAVGSDKKLKELEETAVSPAHCLAHHNESRATAQHDEQQG
jgi:hypothetical protein